MDTLDVARICLRRWYVFVLFVLAALGAGLGLAGERVTYYGGTGDFAVIYRAPAALRVNEPDPRDANPLAAGGGQLLKVSIVNDLRSASSQQELAAPGVLGTGPSEAADGTRFTLTTVANSMTVEVTAFGTNRDLVKATVDAVLAASEQRARGIQDSVGAPSAGRLTTFVTLPSQTAAIPPPSPVKLLVGIMAVGVFAGAAMSLLLDRFMAKRKERRNQNPPTDGPQPPGQRPPADRPKTDRSTLAKRPASAVHEAPADAPGAGHNALAGARFHVRPGASGS